MTQLILNIETPSMEKKIRDLLKGMIGVHVSSPSCRHIEEQNATTAFLSKFSGSWKGNESAEDIIMLCH